jgi:hypothetical protein
MFRSVKHLLLIILVLWPACAHAWNETGHMTVALIAWRSLDEADRERVGKLLEQHPHYQSILLLDRPANVSEHEWAFVRGAVWSDLVRVGPGRPGTVTRYTRPGWHVVYLPYVVDEDKRSITATTHPTRENAFDGFAESTKTLGDTQAKAEDRAVALTWIEHIIGDIHQPMHSTQLYSSMFPTGDTGGSNFAVRVDGNVFRLHGYWDGMPGNTSSYEMVDFLAQQISNEPQSDPTKRSSYKEHTTFESWVRESHEFAISVGYQNGRLRGAPYSEWEAKRITAEDVPALPPS